MCAGSTSKGGEGCSGKVMGKMGHSQPTDEHSSFVPIGNGQLPKLASDLENGILGHSPG